MATVGVKGLSHDVDWACLWSCFDCFSCRPKWQTVWLSTSLELRSEQTSRPSQLHSSPRSAVCHC